ncbi:muscular LMNA-interacting protein isoform X2 [Myxocyprinus asiaticus]|uniref:muscular LMNA-interacting protein isoform X2 n=1 Tax=Myxocyprinus asiaticus TaxID=70543 RepID=UPI0022226998|nr:muscular LMNA-interacting protein isoform X2 [Myxocyprinus asiaticus]
MLAQKPLCTTNTNTQMALEQPQRTFGKVTTVFATKLKSFTFVPLLKRLPNENRVTVNWKKALQTSWPNKTREPGDSEDIMADERVYKAEVIYIQDPEEGKTGETFKNTTQSEIQSTDNLMPNPHTTLVGPHTEFGSITPKSSPATMETIDNKHLGIPHLSFHNTSAVAEVSLRLFLNSTSQRDEVLSPANSMDFITSSASSKESILSEGWDKDRSWPALHMLSPNGSPVPLSRTVSPCSSIRSGSFTPSVVRIKRHALAPGSSLMSSACGTPCCGSRATSPCPLSPHARHRPPPTQLSLLTAILRKGRLPVLSSTLQRHYTPCWPISPISMSSCLACSAASAIAPMNMSKAKSCSSIDRPSSEPCQNSKPQPLKPDHSSLSMSSFSKAPKEIPLQPPKRLDSWLHVTSSSIILPTKDSPLTSPSLLTVKAAPTHLSISDHKDNHLPTVPSPLSCTYFSHLRSLSPKSSSLSCCSPETTSVSGDHTVSMDPNNSFATLKLYDEPKSENGSLELKQGQKTSDLSAEPSLKHTGRSSDNLSSLIPKPAQNSYKSYCPTLKCTVSSCDNSTSPVLNHTENRPGTLLQNGSKIDVERVHLSPSPRPLGLTHLSFTPPASSACPSVYPNSRSSTPERCTLSPSPAALSRQLSPSPSYSLSSSPSPSLWGSTPDCADRNDKNRKTHKIKSTYKAIAAIPTNTLLQEQQAIDDEVNKKEALVNPADNYTWEDPHSKHQTHHVNKTPALGEEAPRANFHCQPCLPTEKTQTKPGVIRPVLITSRLTDDKEDEEFHPNPFKSYKVNTSSHYKYKFVSNPLLNESTTDGRGAPDWHCADGEEQGDSKSSLVSLITQTRSSQQDVPISIHTHKTHI